MEDMYFDPVKPEDLELFEEITSECAFELGLANRKVLYEMCPEFYTFIRKTSTGKYVGIMSCHVFSENVHLRYQVYIRPEYRTGSTLLGITKVYFDLMFPNYKGNYFYNCNHKSLRSTIVHFTGEIFGPKFICYAGNLDHKRLHHIPPMVLDEEISVLTTKRQLELLKDYERTFNPIPRDAFLEKWCLDPENAITTIAMNKKSNKVVAYATARVFNENEYWITMAYAESADLAVGVLKSLFSRIPNGKDVWMAILADNRRMIELLSVQLNLEWIYADQRVYRNAVIEVPWEKIFIANEAFLF